MDLLSLLILTSLCSVGQEALSVSDCDAYARTPQYSDLTVACGSSSIDLAVQICPLIYTGLNESSLVLNDIDAELCQGRLDTSAEPPVVRFSVPVRQGYACGSTFSPMSVAGTGSSSDSPNSQNISGIVRAFGASAGTVTNNTEIKYHYSCSYSPEFYINNTHGDVSSSSVALKDNNGSFLSTLGMALYQDINYTKPLLIPPLGVDLRTNIYVQVSASNLPAQYLILLDRCYTSLSLLPRNSTFFNLFVSCSVDPMTTMLENGVSQKARFYFPAFRFTKQQNEAISTYYLHCITRLCKPSTCSSLKQCNRRKRSVKTAVSQGAITMAPQLTLVIRTLTENAVSSKDEALSGGRSDGRGVSGGLAVAAAFLFVTCVAAIVIAASLLSRAEVTELIAAHDVDERRPLQAIGGDV